MYYTHTLSFSHTHARIFIFVNKYIVVLLRVSMAILKIKNNCFRFVLRAILAVVYIRRTRINLTNATDAAKYTLGKIKFMARCCLGDGVLRFIVIHSCILYALKFTDRSLLSHNSNILIVIIFSTPFRYYVRIKIIRERNYILAIYV